MKRKQTKRNVELLVRVAEYGHVTVELLRLWFPGLSASAAGTWIKRLRKSGWLESAPLDRHSHYYRLSNKAVRYLKQIHGVRVSRAMTRALKPYRKPDKHAFAVFLSTPGEFHRQPFRPFRDSERFPSLAAYVAAGKADPLRQLFFYSVGRSVGLFALDHGSPWFVRKLRQRVIALITGEHPKAIGDSIQKLAAAQQFQLTIATTSASRKAELEAEIRLDPPPFTFEVLVMEEIAALLPSQISLRGSGERQERNKK